MNRLKVISEVGLLAALIAITGSFKLPGLMPGTEFQLSAPLAVAICAVFGFSRYIAAGVIASVISLALGTQTLVNVFVAMIFRLVAGGTVALAGPSLPAVVVAGPLGSSAARLALSVLVGKAAVGLLLAALPGMLYTALTAWPLTLLLRRVRAAAGMGVRDALQR